MEENNDNSFKIKLCGEWFKHGDVVIKETFPEKLKRFAEWLGFYSKYGCKVSVVSQFELFNKSIN